MHAQRRRALSGKVAVMEPVRIGIAGLGIAVRQILSGFDAVDGVQLTAVADIRHEELESFQRAYPGVRTFSTVEALCESDDVDAVWVATPNHLHAEHVVYAAENGKHIICEKPMATTMADANMMVAAVQKNEVIYVQGHSKIYRNAIRAAGKIVHSGEIGRPIQIHTLMYNDWLRRPVTEAEVDERRGGGVVFRQAPHQVDIVRYLAGGRASSIRASAGRAWGPTYDIEGHYSAHLDFDNGCVALCGFNGYGHLDIAELTWGIGEGGRTHGDDVLFGPRPAAKGPIEAATKYKLPQYSYEALSEAKSRSERPQDFFGLTIISCEYGDIRQSARGLFKYTSDGVTEVPVPDERASVGELRELVRCIRNRRRLPFPDAFWARATLECVIGIVESSDKHEDIALRWQTDLPESDQLGATT